MGNKKYKVGYTCGVFDLFHYGHLNLLEKCKDLCEILIVGVCDDDYVVNIKNKTPIFNQEERARILQALEVVDKTVIVDTDKEIISNEKHYQTTVNNIIMQSDSSLSESNRQYIIEYAASRGINIR